MIYIVIFISFILFSGAAVFGLYWAARNGQLRQFEKGAEVIFDRDEHVGKSTDSFPDRW